MAQKRVKRSVLWAYFKEGTDEAKCNYCSLNLSTKSGSLGNLKRHMTNKHPTKSVLPDIRTVTEVELLSREENNSAGPSPVPVPQSAPNIEPPSQPKITSYVRRPLPVRRVEQVVAMVTKGHHSFRVVEEPEIRKLIEMVSTCPGYQLPSRKTQIL